MAPALIRSKRSALMVGLAIGMAGLLSTASADAGGAVNQSGSTSPHVGEPLERSTAEQRALSAHLKARGAVFYGAWWCPACFQQKNLFGKEGGNTLPYVECDKTEAGRQVCMAAKVRAFPTWDLPGQPRLEGVQTLEELKAWSQYPGSSTSARP